MKENGPTVSRLYRIPGVDWLLAEQEQFSSATTLRLVDLDGLPQTKPWEFVRLKKFYLLIQKKFQKVLQIVCVLRSLVGLLVYVLRRCYRFFLIMRKEIQ